MPTSPEFLRQLTDVEVALSDRVDSNNPAAEPMYAYLERVRELVITARSSSFQIATVMALMLNQIKGDWEKGVGANTQAAAYQDAVAGNIDVPLTTKRMVRNRARRPAMPITMPR